MAETIYQKRTKVRRMSDIERLASQYKKNVEAMTGEYQQSFGEFEANRAKAMEPYNLALAQYKTTFSDYEKQAADYRERLAAHSAALADVQANPRQLVGRTIGGGKRGFMYEIEGERYSERAGLPKGYSVDANQNLYKDRPIPTFTEKAPRAPTAPTMPELAEFDSSSLAARRGELEATFKREVGERKAARLGAVSRRATRPMLQET
jgi:hypothetical protein